jgi:hypothetical protein
VFLEKRDDMFVVELDGLEIEQERGLAVQPEGGRGDIWVSPYFSKLIGNRSRKSWILRGVESRRRVAVSFGVRLNIRFRPSR